MKRIVCENIRSAYNMGNIIRTADALGRGVIVSGYSAPLNHAKVQKTALGAQEHIPSQNFGHPDETLDWLEKNNYLTIAAEKNPHSIPLEDYSRDTSIENIAVIVGNEVVGVREETLQRVDHVIHIPMLGIKESLNVGQAAAIFMWHLSVS